MSIEMKHQAAHAPPPFVPLFDLMCENPVRSPIIIWLETQGGRISYRVKTGTMDYY
jgi:hypothetical protein